MKASQKILIGSGAIITLLIFTIMIIIRDDIQTQFVKEDGWRFKPVDVGKFDRLEFSAHYQADVVSGMEYSVEMAVKDSARISPKIQAVDGSLYFSGQRTDSLNAKPMIKVKITMPILKSVLGRAGSEVTLRNFRSDSLTVSIEKGCVFKGRENVIKSLTFRAGDALLEWTNNP